MTYERPNIEAMQGYEWGEQPDDDETIKLNTNENPYPPSPQTQQALNRLSVDSLRRYPDPTASGLRKQLSALHGCRDEQVVITNGGDEALRLAFTTFVEPGRGFGTTEPSYSLYSVLANVQGASVHAVPLLDDNTLPGDFAQQLNAHGVQLTCVVNPHAPTGTLFSTQTLGRLAEQLDGVLLIDEAYVDFVDEALSHDTTALINQHDNVLLLRTLSKGYSLAGLRMGYLLGPAELISPVIWKTRDSYNIDYLSQAIGAAAIGDQAYARATWARVREERSRMQQQFETRGLTVTNSQTNFLLVDFSASNHAASAIQAALKNKGILVRYFDTPRLAQMLRITIGRREENDALLAALDELL